MRSGSLLLRLLLSLVLALNGVATAMAGTHLSVPMQEAGADMTAMQASPVMHAGCHDSAASADLHAGMGMPSEQGAPDSGHDSSGGEGCCESGTCRCDCLQATQAALPASSPGVAVIVRTRDALPPGPSYPAPALPEPVRPPIA